MIKIRYIVQHVIRTDCHCISIKLQKNTPSAINFGFWGGKFPEFPLLRLGLSHLDTLAVLSLLYGLGSGGIPLDLAEL